MRFVSGAAAHQLSIEAMAPIVHAIGAGLGPDKRARLFASGNVVTELSTGVDVARFMAPERGLSSAAPKIFKELLVDAERDLGDGTARLAVLTHVMFCEAVRAIGIGIDRRSLSLALKRLMKGFELSLAASAGNRPCLQAIAQTAGASPQLAKVVADAAHRVGSGGTVDIVAGDGYEAQVEFRQGFVMKAEPIFSDMRSHSFQAAFVLVANEIIDDFGQLVPLLEAFASHGKSLVILARDVTGLARQTLAANRAAPNVSVIALKPAAVAQEAADILADAATATGAQLVCSLEGTSLSALKPAMLGRIGGFIFADKQASFADPGGSEEARHKRSRMLLAEAERKRLLSLDRERLLHRAARLRGNFAELRLPVGTAHNADGERNCARRVVASVMSALASGVVSGGPAAWAQYVPQVDDPADVAARRCVMAGIVALHDYIAFNRCGRAASSRDALKAGAALAAMPVDDAVQDPLAMTIQIFTRAASAAEALAGGGAILSAA